MNIMLNAISFQNLGKTLLGILVFILILGVIVLIHEGGHFFFAKKAGILCYEFSIGMGPLIWQIKKGETYYSIRAIPIGGYVSMAGEEVENNLLKDCKFAKLTIEEGLVKEIYGVKSLEEKFPKGQNPEEFYQILTSNLIGTKEELEGELFITILENGEEHFYPVAKDCIVRFGPKEQVQIAPFNRLFINKKLWQRFLTVFAGPAMNFVLALAIFFVMGLCTGYTNYKSTKISDVDESTPAYAAGLRDDDRILYIGNTPSEYERWDDISHQMQIYANGEDFNGTILVTYLRNGETLQTTVSPLVYVQTIQLLFTQDGTASLEIDEYPNNKEETMTYKAGVRKGDILVSITNENGVETTFANRMEVLKYFNTGLGSESNKFTLKVLRDGDELTLDQISSYKKQIFTDNNIDVCKVQLGISPTLTRNFFRVIGEPFKEVGSSCLVIFKTLGALFRRNSGISIMDLSGPVGIATATVSIVDQGFLSVLDWMAILSVNIGLMNIIPLPALDGGRLAFLLYEAITKKKTNPKVENIIHTVGFILLMVLFVFVAFNDVFKIFK